MPVNNSNINKVEDPCNGCKDRHLKCDDNRPRCRQCERLGIACHRSFGAHKFRFGSSAKYDQNFAKDQIWLAPGKHARFQFVDQGPELENFYSTENYDLEQPGLRITAQLEQRILYSSPEETSASAAIGGKHHSTGANGHWPVPVAQSPRESHLKTISPAVNSIHDVLNEPSPAKRRKTNENETPRAEILQNQQPPPPPSASYQSRFYVPARPSKSLGNLVLSSSPSSDGELQRMVYAEYERLEDGAAAWIPPGDLLAPHVWKSSFYWPNSLTTIQCACMMRFFTEQLGPWFDVGDASRHFTFHVPQAARRCPPLLNAVFAISARHLISLPRYRNSDGKVRFYSNVLHRMDDSQHLKYQTAAVAYLSELCKHPEHVQDEDLLAAIVILRYYEEYHYSFGNSLDEPMMRSFQLFIAAQAVSPFQSRTLCEKLDFSVPGTFSQNRSEVEAYINSYQHASCRVALRQECSRSLMKQKPIEMPLGSWSILQGFDEANDFVWADRHLYHLACVLQFCFDETLHQQTSQKWHELKSFECQWEAKKPFSFAAIHYKTPNHSTGETLPEIWYLADVHAIATQYYDLSRILLAVYNPTVPRLGPGASVAAKSMSVDVRQMVIEICGIAISLPGSEPALNQAFMAIALCGQHITDRHEQTALLSVLSDLKRQHGYPTSDTVETLNKLWSE